MYIRHKLTQQEFDNLVATKLKLKTMKYHEAAEEAKADFESLDIDCTEQYEHYTMMLSW